VPRRIIRLTEYAPHDCRLRRADARFLLANHRGRIDAVPAGGNVWRLTALGVVGVIDAPHSRLVIRPKVPLANLLVLLGGGVPSGPPTGSSPTGRGDLVGVLAALLADRLGERLADGLRRDYRELPSESAFVRGRLDLPRLARSPGPTPGRLPCVADEFTLDLPHHRAARAAATACAAHPGLDPALRHRLTRAAADLADVAVVPLTPALVAEARAVAPPAYAPLLEVCGWLAAGWSPGEAGDAGPAFLLEMDRVFEGYVSRAAAGCQGARLQAAVPVAPGVTLRPDVTVTRAGEPVHVLDAKWKRPRDLAVSPADLYQVTAYAAALGARRATLVYPGRRDRRRRFAFGQSGVTVEVRTLRVVGPPEACDASHRRFGRWLARA
jgi:5-methylcytosine-specific restriction enzyme subunit McrC